MPNQEQLLVEDGLPVLEVGGWAAEKHERLRRYVTISANVRAKFVGPGKAGATYIELFCGPGRIRDRDTGWLRPGGTLVAVEAARASGHPFSEIHLSDVDPGHVAAARQRLVTAGVSVPIKMYSGLAAVVAEKVVASLNPYALHFAFLDPFNLGALPVRIIEAFAGLRRIDLLMHVSAMDLQRNLEQAISADEFHHFDAFAPGWREAVAVRQAPHVVRRELVGYWATLVRNMGFSVFAEDQFELIRGTRNQPLYWLAMASKNDKAGEFWDKIRSIDPQRGLDL
jgi:three-Cys-motif partner protein